MLENDPRVVPGLQKYLPGTVLEGRHLAEIVGDLGGDTTCDALQVRSVYLDLVDLLPASISRSRMEED
ncbi:hypothetical protein [Rhodococcus triatomae]